MPRRAASAWPGRPRYTDVPSRPRARAGRDFDRSTGLAGACQGSDPWPWPLRRVRRRRARALRRAERRADTLGLALEVRELVEGLAAGAVDQLLERHELRLERGAVPLV